ncbi:MAG TPA: hypothetical protein PLR65_07475, partial [Anaerolineales bacterium]|nr:hypothetical protein [Anaerolineales bacterium]
ESRPPRHKKHVREDVFCFITISLLYISLFYREGREERQVLKVFFALLAGFAVQLCHLYGRKITIRVDGSIF